MKNFAQLSQKIWLTRKRIIIFLGVFGPATIAAMADNDAAGVATYLQAGAKLGYPIIFMLTLGVILLSVTQEMGIRLSIVSRKGLGDHIREQFGLKTALIVFSFLFATNLATITADVSAMKITAELIGLNPLFLIICFDIFAAIFVIRGNYRINQSLMLFACLFFITFIISAVKASPDWGLAVGNIFFPHGVVADSAYILSYLLMAMSVLGTTVTPWGQFFISSFTFDKNIDPKKLKYSQLETYFGSALMGFFSFFIIVSTAATLFYFGVKLTSGADAALTIRPFAGELAGTLFAVGILNAGFMGMLIISLTTAYAFSEFFGISGSLDAAYHRGKTFYRIFLLQILIASAVVMLPAINLFKLALFSQTVNAMMLPLVFYFLVKFTDDKSIMGEHVNNKFQRYFAIAAIFVILIASFFTLIASLFNF